MCNVITDALKISFLNDFCTSLHYVYWPLNNALNISRDSQNRYKGQYVAPFKNSYKPYDLFSSLGRKDRTQWKWKIKPAVKEVKHIIQDGKKTWMDCVKRKVLIYSEEKNKYKRRLDIYIPFNVPIYAFAPLFAGSLSRDNFQYLSFMYLEIYFHKRWPLLKQLIKISFINEKQSN